MLEISVGIFELQQIKQHASEVVEKTVVIVLCATVVPLGLFVFLSH